MRQSQTRDQRQETIHSCLWSFVSCLKPQMYPILEILPIVPNQIPARLRQMFRDPPTSVVAQMRDVLAETLALIERHYPQIDTQAAHYSLTPARVAYAGSIQL